MGPGAVHPRCRALALPLALAVASPLFAQEELRWEGPTPATVRLGDQSRIELNVEGRAADPRTPVLPKVDGMQLQVTAPSRHSFMQFDRGRMVERHTVQYTVLLRPLREGSFAIPPIEVFTGTRTQRTAEFRLDAVKDIKGGEFGYLEVTVEPQRVYVHEPIWVRVEFGADAGLRPVTDLAGNRYRFIDFEVQAPWLGSMEGAVPVPVPEPPNATPVVLNRSLQMAEYAPAQQRNGKTWHAFSFDKAFLPTRAGVVELSAPLLRYHVMLREGRVGLFGERVGSQTQNYYVYGKPLRIEVLPIPEAGRPNPYYGAVGRFTIEAALDKNTVKVGGSLKVSFTVRGHGNLEFLRVPELDQLPGLHKLGQTEKRDQEQVTVVYDLSPLDAAIREVPEIAWNWFDTTPGVERFVEARTRPLPISVQPLENGETLLPLPGADAAPVVPGVDDIHDLRPLEGPPVPQPARPGTGLLWLALLGPWLLALGLLSLRRALRAAAADPAGRRARMAARTCARALAGGEEPAMALAGYLADRIGVPRSAVIGPDLRERLRAAGLGEELAAEAAQALERGVASRYGGTARLDPAAVRDLVQRLEPVPLRRTAVPSLLLAALLGALLAAPSARAQDGDPVAAYRRGDYANAAAGFAALASSTGDARAFYDLGNAHYRQGDLPRAIWAWEQARLGLPRDGELRANLALARRKLELGEGGGEPFLEAVGGLRRSFTPGELLLLGGLCQAGAAFCLLLGWRRGLVRAIGFLLLVHGALLLLELVWFGPSRPPRAIALQRLEITAEPREDMPAVATVRPGAEVVVLGGSESWLRVEAAGRRGYVRTGAVGVVR